MSKLLRRISTTASDRPPSYRSTDDPPSPPPAADSDAVPPPFTEFPSLYQVGRYRVKPWVEVDDIKAHLVLLGAFRKLRDDVEATKPRAEWPPNLEPKALWAVFVQVAVYRFEVVVHALETSARALGAVTLPVDVALVLHAYLLNPLRYDEDCVRRAGNRSFKMPNGEALEAVARSIDLATLTQREPSSSNLERWRKLTDLPFDPFESFRTSTGRRLRHFRELKELVVLWVTADGTGYAQQGFKAAGPNGLELTHEALGVAKFVHDYVTSSNEVQVPVSNNIKVIAGTVTTSTVAPESTATSVRALWVRDRLMKHLKDVSTPLELGERLGWSQDGLRKMLRQVLNGRERGVNNIASCYTRGEPFSLDLGMAVLRQGSFVDKMCDLGWTRPERFAADDILLKRCIARYHAFIDLMASSPSSFCVPTLDIDLAWHTHQLKSSYKLDTALATGRFIDHDDKVEEGALATGFDVTARAWKSRFGVPYSTCGCPLPSQPPLSRLSAKLGLSSSAPASYPPGALITLAPSCDDADATHPSAHNALVLPDHPQAQRKRAARAAELDARRRRDDKAGRKAQAARGKKGEALPAYEKRREGQRDGHAYAFLAPMPLVPLYYGPMGYPASAAGCATTDGNHASAQGGAACGGGSAGAGACGAGGIGGCGSSGGCGGGGSVCGGGGGGFGGCGGGGGGGGGCGGGGGGGGCGGGGGGS
ncbi:uncharacterized protein RHOBADRAFT_54728 [Rhodotorula graminis WP1]|uniref:Uncharacterized protein n=1 Tax=Rhodotorula graminis (strain WP1) TaxID=578459 RepID=A0A0N8PZX1_RHOGW|nr:uncharacterized protein RHOBADRAFT_54728 [Rhodotorula graminis WP1]KPV73509.1 hypothetical protein RHOBADRAFT_54728 [Rhodotorula graminis WP1]